MGGSTPVAPVQDNSAQLLLLEQMAKQQELSYKQYQDTQKQQSEADEAAAENMRQLSIREAKAKAEAEERAARAAKGKKDLLYRNALGATDDEEDNGGFLKLGGA